MKKLKVILIGAGNRGEVYTDLMKKLPEKYQVVAVADPEVTRREHFKTLHGMAEENCCKHYDELLSREKFADLVIISTQDKLHYDPAMKAIEKGYDILLEKPIAPTAKECLDIKNAAEAKGVRVIVCTVLRYTPLYGTVKQLILDGKLGDIVSITHEECVGNIHQSHSFVRGNWGNEERSACMLLAKSCHDLDLLPWLIGKKCKKIQSFGALSHFHAKNAPADAPERCIEGCPHKDCFYNAEQLYLHTEDPAERKWFRTTSTLKQDPTDEEVEAAQWNTQYGKCVYKCDNDVVDHQTLNMLFEDDITATFSMNAFNRGGRFTNIYGTKGEIRISLSGGSVAYPAINFFDFATREWSQIEAGSGSNELTGGHGGGDAGIVNCLYDYLTGQGKTEAIPTIGESCHNHILVFAAEQARHTGTIVDVDAFIENL